MGANYFPEDHEKVDCFDVTTAEHLRPFLAHVIGGLDAIQADTFLHGLAALAAEMRAELPRRPLTGPQRVLLETARFEGSLTLTTSDRRDAAALAKAGLVTLTPGPRATVTITPVERPPL